MKDRSSALNLAVTLTIALLLSAGLLVVVGICDSALSWDIFPPDLEKFLHALFGSSLALALVGLAITLVLGINEAVRALRSLLSTLTSTPREVSTVGNPMKNLAIAGLVVLLMVSLLGATNSIIRRGKIEIFKSVAADQFAVFSSKLATELENLSAPPKDRVPRHVFDYVKALDNMEVFNRATLYMRDPASLDTLWGYTAWRDRYETKDGFAPFSPVKSFEKAMRLAFDGNASALDEINSKNEFEWYGVIKLSAGTERAILRLDGNPADDYGSYIIEHP